MIGDPRITEILNEVLTNELTAINQYYLHHAMQKNWGYVKLAEHTYHESIDEMKHADLLIHRLLFLEAHPNLQRLNPLRIGETVREQLEADLSVEVKAMGDLRRGIELCNETGDSVTRLLFEGILKGEEDHVDYLETQLGLLDKLGEQHYLAQTIQPGE